jgi:hypothetical protein
VDASNEPVGVATRTTVTIARTHADDVQQRQIYARVDESPNRTLVFGDSVTIEITPGDHVLKANNTLQWKSVPFTVREGEHAQFMLINKAGALSFGFLALLGVGPLALKIERVG